jgi:hypothetical protein
VGRVAGVREGVGRGAGGGIREEEEVRGGGMG